MPDPTRDERTADDTDVTTPDLDAEQIVNEQQPDLDPAGPTELGDAVDG